MKMSEDVNKTLAIKLNDLTKQELSRILDKTNDYALVDCEQNIILA